MNLNSKKSALIQYLNMKVFDEDWRGVVIAALDLREFETSQRLAQNPNSYQTSASSDVQAGPATGAAVPPVEIEIPHHVNEVANLLKLGDEDLVDKLFPDYTKEPERVE